MKRLLYVLVVAVTVASAAGIMAQTPDPGRGGVWVTGAGGGGGGDITEVVAGAGMTGGGDTGDVTLNVIGTADAITVSADAVTIASTYVGQTSITTLGTVATGTWQATDVGVAYGGTGVSTLTDGGVLLGSGTGAVTALAALADGAIVIGDGTGDPTTLDVGSSTAITVLGTVATGAWEATDVGVAHGGTGVSSLTANSLLIGAGTSAVTFAAPGASGNVLTSNGTVWASAAPSGGGTSLDTGTVEYAGRTITVDTGGSLDVVLAASAGDDFTVDTTRLVVSGDETAVGINTAAPVSLLDVRGPTGTGAASAGLMTLATNELTIVDNDQLGRIDFRSPIATAGTDAIVTAASIWSEANATFSASVNSADIVLATSESGAPVEHLRLDSRGTMRYGYEGTGKGTQQNESWGTVWGNNTYYNGSAWVAVATAASSNIAQGSAGDIIFRSAPSVSAGASTSAIDNVTISANGNVGVGTAAGSKLEVAGDAANTNENSAQLQLIGSTDANKQLRIGYNTTANNGFIQAVRVGTGQDALLLNPDGGNVGIGVTPAAKLDIDVGTGQVLIRTLNPDSLMITENDADIYGGEIALQKSRGSYASPGDVVNGDGLGNLKTSAWSGSAYWATAKIDYAVDGTFTSNTRPPSRITFSTNAANAAVTERMRITGAGNVGIGTAAPVSPLDVTKASGSSFVAHFTNTTNATPYTLRVEEPGSPASGYPLFDIVPNGGASAYFLVQSVTGNVGIAETAPNDPLHITTDTGGAVTMIRLQHDGDSTNDAVSIDANLTSSIPNTSGRINFKRVGTNAATDIIFSTTHTSGSMTDRMTIASDGAVTVVGSLSKGSGSFKIDHPLPAMNETHSLVHSFIEGPRADLIYRGIVTMVDGSATVDLDDAAGMTSGTWVLLCRDPQVFSSNTTGWSPVRGTVSGSTLTIESEEGTSTDTVSWMVVAERQDQHMIDTGWTDEDGRPIVEPLKSPVAAPAPAPAPAPGITPDPDPV